jgi:hypothetical protein
MQREGEEQEIARGEEVVTSTASQSLSDPVGFEVMITLPLISIAAQKLVVGQSTSTIASEATNLGPDQSRAGTAAVAGVVANSIMVRATRTVFLNIFSPCR